jgi:membrane dipeptidase
LTPLSLVRQRTNDAIIDGDTQVDLPKLERGGVDAIVLAAFVSSGPRERDKIKAARAELETKLNAIRSIPVWYPERTLLARPI